MAVIEVIMFVRFVAKVISNRRVGWILPRKRGRERGRSFDERDVAMKAGDCSSTTFEPRTMLESNNNNSNNNNNNDDIFDGRRRRRTIVVMMVLDSDIERQSTKQRWMALVDIAYDG